MRPVQTLTVVSRKEISTRIHTMKHGKIDFSLFGTVNGPKPASVPQVVISRIARGMDFIYGMGINGMYWFAIRERSWVHEFIYFNSTKKSYIERHIVHYEKFVS